MTEQELLQQIEEIKQKKSRSIYDFNKLRKLEQQLKELQDERNQTTREG